MSNGLSKRKPSDDENIEWIGSTKKHFQKINLRWHINWFSMGAATSWGLGVYFDVFITDVNV